MAKTAEYFLSERPLGKRLSFGKEASEESHFILAIFLCLPTHLKQLDHNTHSLALIPRVPYYWVSFQIWIFMSTFRLQTLCLFALKRDILLRKFKDKESFTIYLDSLLCEEEARVTL